MTPRYGILVQMAQLLAQLFIDWCLSRDTFGEPFAFMVPRAFLSGLEDEHTGILVSISPVPRAEQE